MPVVRSAGRLAYCWTGLANNGWPEAFHHAAHLHMNGTLSVILLLLYHSRAELQLQLQSQLQSVVAAYSTTVACMNASMELTAPSLAIQQ